MGCLWEDNESAHTVPCEPYPAMSHRRRQKFASGSEKQEAMQSPEGSNCTSHWEKFRLSLPKGATAVRTEMQRQRDRLLLPED